MKNKLIEERKKYQAAYKEITKADQYTSSYLMRGSGCDSSKDASFRMEFVLQAEKEFVKEHQKEILEKAAKLVKHQLEEVGWVTGG